MSYYGVNMCTLEVVHRFLQILLLSIKQGRLRRDLKWSKTKPNPFANKCSSSPIFIPTSLIYLATNVKSMLNSILVSKPKIWDVHVWNMPKTMFETVIVEHFRTHHKGHMPSPTSNCQKIKVNEASRHHTTIGFSMVQHKRIF